ncbi:MAG: S8 family peptidase [Ruminococcus sp.]|nr:S8 family peptidase [Ruminococcus sp.]
MEKYDHIQIERQKVVPTYRGRSNPMAPKPPMRSNVQHGQKLKSELSQASDSILVNRRDIGIETDSLMVLEISSEALPNEILELILGRFKLYLVEETPIAGTDKSKLVVQFENQTAIDQFNAERALWESDEQVDTELLTYAKRRDLFRCIETIRSMTREDRIGPKLKLFTENIMPDTGFFIVNVDVWFNNDRTKKLEIEHQIRQALGTQGSQLLGDLFEIPGLLLGRVKVNEFSLNALLSLDIVCMVELPYEPIKQEPFELYSYDFTPIVNDTLDDNAPLAAVLDSGVFTGNPLLRTAVVAEEEFDTTEHSTTDFNGHGTGVAGIVVYGDFHSSIQSQVFTPRVRICNGKIMHNENDDPVFPKDVRPEKIVKDAITFFHNTYGCRIFNLSAGNGDSLYQGGRQFPWASMLDDLARELDIVIVVSAGNVINPIINDFSSRDELMQKARNQLFDPEHRLIDPATSALSVTVGSITRFAEPALPRFGMSNPLSAGKKKYPSVFTRIGKGVNKSIKPDFVDYGGNFSLRQIAGGFNRWFMTDQNLMEPTLNHTTDKIFKGFCGTSFSAPHVTHMAARLERALEKQLGQKPSANLIRAMLANSAECSAEMEAWGMNSTDAHYTGLDNPKRERLMRLNGYGKISDRSLFSTDNSVTLFAEDKLPLRDFHLYKIPIPKQFAKIKAAKSITISMAYNPITKISRKEYLANNLWIEVFRRIDEDTLIKYKAKRMTGTDTEEDFKNLPDKYKIKDFLPGYDALQKSTLQQRCWHKSTRGGSDLLWEGNDEPYIYILISGKERFKYAQQEQPQPYALCISFSYESEDNIDLYNQLRNNVRLKESTRVPTRIRV